jgi:hypothetical protein
MASPAYLRLQNELAKSKARASNLAKKVRKPKYDEVTALALKVGGGAVAGYVSQSTWNKVGGVQTPILIGGALVAYSMFVAKPSDQMGMYASCIGVGMLSGVAYEWTATRQYEQFMAKTA